jgi:hypothetical protein
MSMNLQDNLRLPVFPDQLHYLVDLSARIKLHQAGATEPNDELALTSDVLLEWIGHRAYLRHKGTGTAGLLIEFMDTLVFDLMAVVNGKEPVKPVDNRRIEVLWQYIRHLEELTYKVEVRS